MEAVDKYKKEWVILGILENKMGTRIMESQMGKKWKMKWKLGNVWG